MGDEEREARTRAEDELLAVRCQLGEKGAFDELIRRWHGPLWAYAHRMTRSSEAAAETTQEVWLRLVRGIGCLRDGGRLRGWLFGIARRVVMDRLRESYAAPAGSDDDASGIAADLPDENRQLDAAIVQRELAALPLVEREILTLHYLEELSLADAAVALAVPVGTVKSRLFRARRLLREALREKGVLP